MFKKLYNWIMDLIPKVRWHKVKYFFTGKKHDMQSNNIAFAKLCKLLVDLDDAIILTSDKSSLSSWGVKLLHFLLTGKFADYSHALLKFDDVFIEAVNSGVRYSSFDEITKCDSLIVLIPKHKVNLKLNKEALANWECEVIGKSYDKYFDLYDRTNMSCIEVVYDSLKIDGTLNKMEDFKKLLQKKTNLTPQMIKDCNDFQILFEFKGGNLI